MNRQSENTVHLERSKKSIENARHEMILIVLILVIATIALVMSIKLVFTIGRQTSVGSSSSSYNITTTTTPSTSLSLTLVTSILTEPCGCDCPSVKPEFGALRIVYAANCIWSFPSICLYICRSA